MNTLGELMSADLECRLTIAHAVTRDDTDCARYFIARREVLLPEVVLEAKRRGIDAADLFAEYARKVHERHLSGLSLKVTS